MATMADKINDLHRELIGLQVQRLTSESRGGPSHVSFESVPIPPGQIAEKATKFAFDNLDESIFNHSLRTYYLAAIIGADQYPSWSWNREALYLSSILHDIGLSKKSIDNTVMSFEYDGALQAHQFLVQNGAEKGVSDIVFEAVARHSDLYVDGKSAEGVLISMGAATDVSGFFGHLLHQSSAHEIIAKYPTLDLVERSSELMAYEMKTKNGQCHNKCYLDLGILDMLANNPLYAGLPG